MAAQSFAQIKFDGVSLLIPQTEVGIIEVSSSIGAEVLAEGSIGTVKSGNRDWPVFALGADFQLRPERPETYKFCLCMNLDNKEVLSIACEEVSTTMLDDKDDLKPVPDCMRITDCPIEFLTLRDHQMMLISNTKTMLQYLVAPEAIEA
ncbi:MAG: hypothetical protein OEY09_03005 [Gammaproteobacteria bacterium]|nr:hypothetical protein [Gammaproteobacteria bacterium]